MPPVTRGFVRRGVVGADVLYRVEHGVPMPADRRRYIEQVVIPRAVVFGGAAGGQPGNDWPCVELLAVYMYAMVTDGWDADLPPDYRWHAGLPG